MTGSTREIAEAIGTDVHFLHEKARGKHFEGMSALCDFKDADLEREPRTHTLSSSTESDVTCEDCLMWLEQGYRK